MAFDVVHASDLEWEEREAPAGEEPRHHAVVTDSARLTQSRGIGSLMTGSFKARLLVATPRLRDPNFDRTVVLVLEHNEEGALGVVLNRPSPLTVGDAIPSLSAMAPPDDPVPRLS